MTDGAGPPRAERLEVGADEYFAKDEHGDTRGGVRCVQMEVPRATYIPCPLAADGTPEWGTVGTERPFTKEKLGVLYASQFHYVESFDRRLDELIGARWFLEDDAEEMRAEARKVEF
jgi:hypothetical protein